MLASAILVLEFLEFLEERVTTTLMESGRALHVYGHPADSIGLTLQELLMLALVALAVDGVTEWLTGRRITRLLVGMVLTVLGSFLLLALLRTPAPLGLVIENVVVIPMCVGGMLLIVLYLGIRAHRIQQLSAVRGSRRSSQNRRTRATHGHEETCSSTRAITVLLIARKNTTGWRAYRVGWVHR
jgi:hypothetical protein